MEEDVQHRYRHLLKPLKDVASNWDICINDYLHEYLDKLNTDRQRNVVNKDGDEVRFNFSEAAMLLQGSLQIYSKKIDSLHDVVYDSFRGLAPKKKKNAAQRVVDASGDQVELSNEFSLSDPKEALLKRQIDKKTLFEWSRRRETNNKKKPIRPGQKRQYGRRDALIDLPLSFFPTMKAAPSRHHIRLEHGTEKLFIPQNALFSFASQAVTQVYGNSVEMTVLINRAYQTIINDFTREYIPYLRDEKGNRATEIFTPNRFLTSRNAYRSIRIFDDGVDAEEVENELTRFEFQSLEEQKPDTSGTEFRPIQIASTRDPPIVINLATPPATPAKSRQRYTSLDASSPASADERPLSAPGILLTTLMGTEFTIIPEHDYRTTENGYTTPQMELPDGYSSVFGFEAELTPESMSTPKRQPYDSNFNLKEAIIAANWSTPQAQMERAQNNDYVKKELDFLDEYSHVKGNLRPKNSGEKKLLIRRAKDCVKRRNAIISEQLNARGLGNSIEPAISLSSYISTKMFSQRIRSFSTPIDSVSSVLQNWSVRALNQTLVDQEAHEKIHGRSGVKFLESRKRKMLNERAPTPPPEKKAKLVKNGAQQNMVIDRFGVEPESEDDDFFDDERSISPSVSESVVSVFDEFLNTPEESKDKPEESAELEMSQEDDEFIHNNPAYFDFEGLDKHLERQRLELSTNDEFLVKNVRSFWNVRTENVTRFRQKMNEWSDFVGKRVREDIANRHFDIHEYGERVFAAFDEKVGTVIEFKKLVKGLQRFEVCRCVQALLIMANNGNVLIHPPKTQNGKTATLNRSQLELLSTKRHHAVFASEQALFAGEHHD